MKNISWIGELMEFEVVNSGGQLTIPFEIMQKMGIADGDKLYFLNRNGTLVIKPANYDPLKSLQDLMEGEAEKVGLSTEEDINRFMKEVRKELAEERRKSKCE